MTTPERILNEVKKAVCGKDDALLRVLIAILAGGHILIEDRPGLGKTTLALAFSRTLSLDYRRVQFTPDVLPSDITGFSIYNRTTGQMEYQAGSVLCNLFLADELNRASSRTQSALLEAMEEGQVTVDGLTHVLPSPFLVIATQNPAGASGTQLLPDSQLDRFMIRIHLGYPKPDDEKQMLMNRSRSNPLQTISPVLTREALLELQRAVGEIHVSDAIYDYIVRLIGATRTDPRILQGASPRASIALVSMAKGTAFACGRDYVLPADLRFIFHETLAHRLLLQPDTSARTVLDEIFKRVAPPRITDRR